MTDEQRRRLYDEVRAEPMVVVAKRYGLSDVGMAKLCRRAQIPVPPRGHWAQLRAGKVVRHPSLPDIDREIIAPIDLPTGAVTPPTSRHSDPEVAAALDREAGPSFQIRPDARRPLHAVSEEIARAYRGGRLYYRGLLCSARDETVVLSVGPGCLARGLQVISLLAHAAEAGAWAVALAPVPAERHVLRALVLRLLGTQFEVSLEEECVRVPLLRESRALLWRPGSGVDAFSWRRSAGNGQAGDAKIRYDLTGRLTLSARSRHRTAAIVDRSKRGSIECRLNELFSRIIRVAGDFRAEDAKRRRAEEERDVAWREHEDREHLRQFQAQLVGELEAQAASWARYQQLAAYIAAVREAHAGEPHLMAPDQPLGRWLAWADAHVAQLDPRRRHELDPENPPPVLRQPRPYRW